MKREGKIRGGGGGKCTSQELWHSLSGMRIGVPSNDIRKAARKIQAKGETKGSALESRENIGNLKKAQNRDDPVEGEITSEGSPRYVFEGETGGAMRILALGRGLP